MFQNADATLLPFNDETFDTIVYQLGIMFFDQATAFREVHRVLRRTGRYLFRVWDSERYNPFASLSFGVLKQFFPSNPPRFLFDPVSCHQIDPLKEQLIHIGFDPIVISVQRHVYDIFDVSAFARALVYSPVIFEIRDHGGVDPEEIVEALTAAFKKRIWLKSATLSDAGHTVRNGEALSFDVLSCSCSKKSRWAFSDSWECLKVISHQSKIEKFW